MRKQLNINGLKVVAGTLVAAILALSLVQPPQAHSAEVSMGPVAAILQALGAL